MLQAKFSVEQTQVDFLNHYQQYGFQNRSAMVRMALNRLKADIEQNRLRQSAELYAELCDEDAELTELTAAAMGGWPE